MDACQQKSLGATPWQAALPSILRDMRSEFLETNSSSAQCHQLLPKELTTGALCVIFVILLFVILTVIRSLISLFENCKVFGKETPSSTSEKNTAANTEREDKRSLTASHSVFLANLKKFLDCFCIQSNTKKILSTVSTEEKLSSLHGIRAVTVIWVLLGHFSMFYISAVKIPEKAQSTLDLQATQIIKNTTFIVDAFLVLGGFLNGYLFFQRNEKKKGRISWLQFYVHRLVRISPMYFLVLAFYATLFSYLGSGPVWPSYDTNPVCRENWMWQVLYINNFNTHLQHCLTTTWYLPCEMQLYLISPIFLIMLKRRQKIGYFLIFLGICGSCLINFKFTKQYNLIDGVTRLADYYSTDIFEFHKRFWEYFDVLYVKPYARMGSFLFGMGLGCYLYQRKPNPIKRNSVLALGWIMAAVSMCTSMFALYGREESNLETAVHNGLKHVLFSSSLSWIIFVCVTGQGGFVNRFLSSKKFILISRLSYTIYLVHLILLEGYFLSLKELIDHSELSMISIHLQAVFWMIAASFVVSLIFEAPLIKVTALVFRETQQELKASKHE